METTVINGMKYLKHNGLLYRSAPESEMAVMLWIWGHAMLHHETNFQCADGRWLHDIAREVLATTEQTLQGYCCAAEEVGRAVCH